ncbi:MAG: Hpt domain-containing protein [Oscillospiraceae bacterium]|nr:Hpt domain-containing protein [Oscillospiraceae bacterium]
MEINEMYIDVKDALKRVGNNMDLYKKLLAQFMEKDHIKPIEEALSAGATKVASDAAHTLKGIAANLSLKKLTEATADLEKNIKDGVEHSDSLAELKQVFYVTSEQIAEII